jgi:hypothetical protein
MKKALYLLLLVSSTALADDAAVRQCRALGEPAARLACYDAIPLGAVASPAAPAAVAAAAAPAAPAVAARTPEQDFGMERMKKAQAEEPKSIESTIVGNFEGWGPNSRFKLANGQVWRVVDGSEAVLAPVANPKVRIEKNFVGTLFLHVEGTNNSAKVRRVQ